MTVQDATTPPRTSLGEIARVFLKLGTIAFGGPAAHIALMREELVRQRGWLTDAEYLDLVGASAIIPGPNSTEVAIHVGARQGGLRGLLVAGACFIMPAVLIVLAVAWAYVRYGSRPPATWLVHGPAAGGLATRRGAPGGPGRRARQGAPAAPHR